MTPYLQNLQAPVPVNHTTHINLPTGSTVNISHTGTVTISSLLSLTDVLCVPNFKHNLLSVQKLIKHNNCEVKFLPTHCVILDSSSQQVIAVGEAKHGLYYSILLRLIILLSGSLLINPSSHALLLIVLHLLACGIIVLDTCLCQN